MKTPSSHLSHVVRRSTAEIAADQLREAIIYGELPMGSPLSEVGIAEKFRISRTPVREAFRLLAQEGLVQLKPFTGANVFTVDRNELRQLFDYREMLELAAVKEAMKSPSGHLVQALKEVIVEMRSALAVKDARQYLVLDSKFHETILAHANNQLLCDAYFLVASRFNTLRTVVAVASERLQESIKSHEALVAIISAGDPESVRSALIKHIRGSEEMFDKDPLLLAESDK